MRLASLHPSLTQSIGVPGAVYTHQLVVDCPTCGSAYRIDEYDGRESVMTSSSYDWVTIP